MNRIRAFFRVTGLLTVLGAIAPADAHGQPPKVQGGVPAQPKLVVRFYPTIVTGVDRTRVVSATKPLIERLEARVKWPIDLGVLPEIKKDDDPVSDLMKFGKQVADGEVHIGIAWGVEYGWLKKMHPNLGVLVATGHLGGNTAWPTRLMVHAGAPEAPVADLKGKILAEVKGAPTMDSLFLDKEIAEAKHDPKAFFARRTTYNTVEEAVQAVKRGDCDCVVLSAMMWGHLDKLKPGYSKHIRTAVTSRAFPSSVLFGDKRIVDGLRGRLWTDLEGELTKLGGPGDARFMEFWKTDRFVKPDDPFRKLIEDRCSEYPLIQWKAGSSRIE